MSEDKPSRPGVTLFGDRAVDHYTLHIPAPGGMQGTCDFENHAGWRSLSVEGGVAMSAAMMRALGISVDEFWPAGGSVLHSSARLTRLRPDAPNNDKQPCHYRINDFEGYWQAMISKDEADARAPGDAAPVLAFNDAGHRLRAEPGIWQTALDHAVRSSATIVHKMHLPLGQGMLWDRIAALKPRDRRRVLHVSAVDLRLSGLRLSRCLSWDRTIEDCAAALRERTVLSWLAAGTDWIVIQFGVEGALLISCAGERKGWFDRADQRKIWLTCDPSSAEGEVERAVAGKSVGQMNLFLAALLQGIGAEEPPDETRLTDALRSALRYTRHYSLQPFEFLADKFSAPDAAPLSAAAVYGPMVESAVAEPTSDSRHVLYHPRAAAEATGDQAVSLLNQKTSEKTATGIVLKGFDQLARLPSARFGALRTIDRGEIEGYRAIDQLFRRYLAQPRRDKPISIAVFGPPGSGKSFGVKQLVDQNVPKRTFNLSEAGPEDLPGFFHDIRDLTLAGETPLCFFDEFDAHGRSLVARFLAPMQDGEFRHATRVHPIGGAIFVFAGGTAESFAKFADNLPDGDPRKIRDFVSRLDGFIDIRGPNPTGHDRVDGQHILRRAVLLRSQIERFADSIVSETGHAQFAPELVYTFLYTSTFRHGARSMEKLVQMCLHRPDQKAITPADLPPFEQLDMHVEAKDFLEKLVCADRMVRLSPNVL